MPLWIRVAKSTLVIFVLACLLYLYLHIALIQNGRNNKLTKSDQLAHMNIARTAYETSFRYTGNRNYMPLYAFLQATMYSPALDDEAFFEQGKRVNIALSIVALALLGCVFLARFSRVFSIYAILVIGFLAFVLKSTFFQPELLYYTFFAFAFILSLETLDRPKWYKSVGVGLLFALAHLTKASAMPGVLVFAASYGVLLLILLVRRELDWDKAKDIVLRALTPVLTFMILLFPYFQETNETYGEYFFNVNSRIYMWYDSWPEAKAARQEVGGVQGFLQLPPNEIPGPEKYLREHTLEQVLGRFRDGIVAMISSGFIRKISGNNYGYSSQVGLGILVIAFALPLLIKAFRWKQNFVQLPVVSYIATLFILYFLSAAWYIPISGSGPRVVLVLLVPFFWIVGMVLHSQQIQSLKITLLQRPMRITTIVYSLLSLTLVWEIYLVVTWRASAMYGGK